MEVNRNKSLSYVHVGVVVGLGLAIPYTYGLSIIPMMMMGNYAHRTNVISKSSIEQKMEENMINTNNLKDAKNSIERTLLDMEQNEVDKIKNIKSYKHYDTILGFPIGYDKMVVEVKE